MVYFWGKAFVPDLRARFGGHRLYCSSGEAQKGQGIRMHQEYKVFSWELTPFLFFYECQARGAPLVGPSGLWVSLGLPGSGEAERTCMPREGCKAGVFYARDKPTFSPSPGALLQRKGALHADTKPGLGSVQDAQGQRQSVGHLEGGNATTSPAIPEGSRNLRRTPCETSGQHCRCP